MVFGVEMTVTLDTLILTGILIDMKVDQMRILEDLNMQSKSILGQLFRVKP